MGILIKKIGNAVKVRWALCNNPGLDINEQYQYKFQEENCLRSSLPFNDIINLSKPIPDEWFRANVLDMHEPLYYGALSSLLDYAGLSFINFPPYKLGIQHGYVFEICHFEKLKLEKRNLVWSKKLVNMYHEHTSNQCIYAIGAPFFYAKSLLDDKQLNEEKKRLGKNLLVFPMHSQIDVDTNYDTKRLLSILSKERERFDTIRICMYWKDILRGTHKVFLEAGYECVCNGHLYDQNFLRRQKSLFALADATLSNGVGSHIGYSIFMNKPHWLIDDNYEYKNTMKGGDAEDLTYVTTKNNFQRVKKAFIGNSDYLITKQQKDVIDEFWGLSDKKEPSELKTIILNFYK